MVDLFDGCVFGDLSLGKLVVGVSWSCDVR